MSSESLIKTTVAAATIFAATSVAGEFFFERAFNDTSEISTVQKAINRGGRNLSLLFAFPAASATILGVMGLFGFESRL